MAYKKRKSRRKRMRHRNRYKNTNKYWISSNCNDIVILTNDIYYLIKERDEWSQEMTDLHGRVGFKMGNVVEPMGKKGFHELKGFVPIKFKRLCQHKTHGRFGKINFGSFSLGMQDSDIRRRVKAIYREERINKVLSIQK